MAVEGPVRRATGSARRLQQEEDGHRDTQEEVDRREREFLTGARSSEAPLPPRPGKAGKFKTVSQLVVAMNRFKASLNPTYTFGKRPPSRSGSESSFSSMSRRNTSDREEENVLPRLPQTHGHKTAYLLSPLPPAPTEVSREKHDV